MFGILAIFLAFVLFANFSTATNVTIQNVQISNVSADTLKITFNIVVCDELAACKLDNADIDIVGPNGQTLSCDLPHDAPFNGTPNCGGKMIHVRLNSTDATGAWAYGCTAYGGKNCTFYRYTIYWNVSQNISLSTGIYNITIVGKASGVLGGSSYYNYNATSGILTSSLPCSAGVPYNNQCVQCTKNSHCTSGYSCINNVCSYIAPSGGGACTTCAPGPTVYPIGPVGVVTTESTFSTDIPATITPGKHCFNIKCLVKTYTNQALTNQKENKLANIPVKIMLKDGTSTTLRTDENGQVCFDFQCGNVNVYIRENICGKEPFSKDISVTYGKLSITSKERTKAKINEELVYIVKDEKGNNVGDVNVNVTINGVTKTLKTNANGKVSFNVGAEEGNYKVIAWKDCYEKDELTGIIIKPKLTITCAPKKNVNETLCCDVKDEEGNAIEGATVTMTLPSGTISLTTDAKGSVCTTNTALAGNVEAKATKEGFKDSGVATSEIVSPVVPCPEECKCGCIEGTTTCKECPCEGIMCYWWIFVVIGLLIAMLLLLLLRKKKVYADEETINRAIKQRNIEDIAKKYSTIYVKRKVYEDIQKSDLDDKIKDKFEYVDLDEKGQKYFDEIKDEDIARAKQLNLHLLTDNKERASKAKDNDVKVEEV